MAILLIALTWHFNSRQLPIVTIEELVQEREQFEAARPVKSTELADLFAENEKRSRSYAATSKWNGKSIIVKGYWGGSFEGISILAKPRGSYPESLMMRPAPDFGDSQFSRRLVPSVLLPDAVIVKYTDYVRITAVYHAIGYDKPGSILQWSEWLEFHKIERWNRVSERWEQVIWWY